MESATEPNKPPLGIGTPSWFMWMAKESVTMDGEQFERLSQSLARFSLFYVPRRGPDEIRTHFDLLIETWSDCNKDADGVRFSALLSELIKAHLNRAGSAFDRDTVRCFIDHTRSNDIVSDKVLGVALWESARRVGLLNEIGGTWLLPDARKCDVIRN